MRQQSSLLLPTIPLRLDRASAQVSYTSAIALQLANEWGRLAPEIAAEIYQTLDHLAENLAKEESHAVMDEIWEYFAVQVFPSGWLSLRLHPQGLAKWLQILINHPLHLENLAGNLDNRANQTIKNSNHLFVAHYTHARCYSLLRLAQRAGILRLSNLDTATSSRSFFLPCSTIPWLTQHNELWLSHATEQRLMTQLVGAVDDMFCLKPLPSKTLGLKLAYSLSQQFQAFYAACPIWGEGDRSTLGSASDLMKARLGLVLATQSVLRSLLQDVLGVVAPTEL